MARLGLGLARGLGVAATMAGCVEVSLPPAHDGADVSTPAAPRGEEERPRPTPIRERVPTLPEGAFPNRLAIALAPSRSSGPRVDRLDVTMALAGDEHEGMPLTLTLRESDLGEPGWADRIHELSVEDEEGALPMAIEPTVWESGGISYRVFRSGRPRQGAITVRYRVEVPAASPGKGNFGLYGDSIGLGGPTRAFLLLPPSTATFRTSLQWSLHGLSSDGVEGGVDGASHHGRGAVTFTGTLPELWQDEILAGPLASTAFTSDGETLHAVWLGTPAFDREELLPLVARVRKAATHVFGSTTAAPLVMVRTQEGAPGNAGLTGGDTALLLFSPRTTWSSETRLTVAHEAVHAWIGQSMRLAGREDTSWFTEGFTVHYARKILAGLGELSPSELALELAAHAQEYQGDPHPTAGVRGLPAVSVLQASSPSRVPYAHGSFYAAELDAALLARSSGASSLDDLMRGLFHEPGSAESSLLAVPSKRFRASVLAALGDEGAARFDEVIVEGRPAEPPSNAFGPCLERRVPASPLRRNGVLLWQPTASCRRR